MREWLVAADDRTGAFEVAALFAQVAGIPTVTVGEAPAGSGVVDLGSRALSAADAALLAAAVDESPSAWVAHKIDSTLRGNWAAELMARQQATGRRVVLLPGWPEMGRTCVGGVVFVDGAPIGNVRDQLSDADLLADAAELRAWLDGFHAIAVCDLPDSAAMHDAAMALVGHDVLVAGPAGPIGAAFVRRAGYKSLAKPLWLEDVVEPVLVVCGSASPVARDQIDRLRRARPDIEVIATPATDGNLQPAAVDALAVQARLRIEQLQPQTVVIIGGETAAAVLGEAPRQVLGFADTGMPASRDSNFHGPLVITKAGGFGGPDALVELLTGENG